MIGPTFAQELQAAGLNGLPFSWSPDGTLHYDKYYDGTPMYLTKEQLAGIYKVLEAHDPTKIDNSILARKALEESDMVAMRCFKACTPFPIEWLGYVNLLRNILKYPNGDLPLKPPYPKET